jgi:branched-chain amino acid transport system substrate-binding protein
MNYSFPLLIALVFLTGCGQKPPIVLGYVSGLTGRTADLGTGGRNGIQLAVEQVNAAGGIHGRQVELLIKDDESSPDKGRQVVKELIDAKVDAILGPMVSAVATEVAPIATEAKVLMMAGTVTTIDLSGKDDHFFRPIASNDYHAATMAEYLFNKRGIRRVNAAVNLANKSYSESWIQNFQKSFSQLGGKVERIVTYTPSKETQFDILCKELLSANPDAAILVTSGVDAALFANQARLLDSRSLMVTSEWAGTGKLTELGGSNVEGFVVPQYLDLHRPTKALADFREAYLTRFKHDVGFPAVVAYDAARVVFAALAEKNKDETLKDSILRIRRFAGLQASIEFDAYGDVETKTVLTVIKNGQYVTVD